MICKTRLTLIIILLFGSLLRMMNLGKKPLWLDEIITALFTFGQGYSVIPRETVFSIESIPNFFTYQAQSCSQIAHFLAEQSTHPPLFFCALHQWLGIIKRVEILEDFLAIQLRLLPAFFGILTILLLYYLNRQAFSKKAGLMGAAIMTISPFAVYLSQEARQYTLLLVFVTIALLALVQILKSARYTWFYWLLWGFVNSLGAYTHYFFFLSFIAQLMVILGFFVWQFPRRLLLLFGVTGGVILSYLPWLPTLITHFSSPKTDWLPSFDWFAPIYQLLLGLIIMFVTFPVENQPIFMQVISGMIMLSFSSWLIYQVGIGYRKLLKDEATQKLTLALSLYIVFVFLQLLVIIYGLEKNIAIAPRYNYVYYPALCSLVGASLIARNEPISSRFSLKRLSMIGMIGLASCLFVVGNLFFLKPYFPGLTAQRLNQSPEPMLIVMGYQDEMDLAIGLSYGLALNQIRDPLLTSQFIFLDRRNGYEQIWEKMNQLPLNVTQIWVLGTGLKRVDFPEKFRFNQTQTCQRDRDRYYRIGIPYQRYQCKS